MIDYPVKKRRTDRPTNQPKSILKTKSSAIALKGAKDRVLRSSSSEDGDSVLKGSQDRESDDEDGAHSPPASTITKKPTRHSNLIDARQDSDGNGNGSGDADRDTDDDELANDSFSDAYDDVSGDDESGVESDDSLASVLASSAATGSSTKKRKRADPAVFATSMAKILSSHLTTRARADPVLVRSRKSTDVIDESKLETKAKRVLALEKKRELEKGRVRDVLGVQGGDAERVREREKALRKIAQRGVVRMFNAVRAAQVKGEEAAREAKKGGIIGMTNREQKVTEMSKQSFLELLQTTAK